MKQTFEKKIRNTDLRKLVESGMMSLDKAWNINNMVLQTEVDKVHHNAITKGSGKESRWHTNVRVPETGERKMIRGNSKEEVYDKLYTFYFESQLCELSNLKIAYQSYKTFLGTIRQSSTVQRMDKDYDKYFLRDELSLDILEKPLKSLNANEILSWGTQLIKKYSLTYKRWTGVFAILKNSIQYMVNSNLLDENICDKVSFYKGTYAPERKKPASTQVFSESEMLKVAELAEARALKERNELYYAIQLIELTGCRPGEIMALKFSDFDRESKKVHIHSMLAATYEDKGNGSWGRTYAVEERLKKNANDRFVLIPERAFAVVEKIKAIHRIKKVNRDRLFGVKTMSALEKRLNSICDELQIPRRSPYSLRKGYGSRLLNNRFDSDFVRTQMGHSDIKTTMTYYNYSTTDSNTLLQGLDSAL